MKNYLPYLIPLVVVSIMFLRMKPGREQQVRADRLWIMPAIVGLFIGMGLWFQPHPEPTPLHLAILLGAIAGGVAVGLLRARAFALRRDGEQVFVRTSPLAFLLLVGLLVIRSAARDYWETSGGAVAVDAFMLFALAMVLTNRAMLYRRIRRLPA